MIKTPYELIREKLQNYIPPSLLYTLPNKWERIGNILIIKIPPALERYRREIAEVYASVLKCKSVLEDLGGIRGKKREPNVRLIYGDLNTETIHVENGIRYKLDPSKIMFSSGNMEERIRMATIKAKDEVVVDMFAGIGYFSLPLAVYGSPKKVYAIEINPVAYRYLRENITLNNVNAIVEPLLGDNRKVTPEGVADRVIMGYLHETHNYLPVALGSLKGYGVIHYHEICPNELLKTRPLQMVRNATENLGFRIIDFKRRIVKSYAPGVSHIVLDVKVGRI